MSDPQGILASPLTIIHRTDEHVGLKAVMDIIDRHQVGKVIAGLPISMDGSIGKQAEKVKTFVRELSDHTEVSIEFRDERLSTVSAQRLMKEAGKAPRARDDAIAAALILQGYLDETL